MKSGQKKASLLVAAVAAIAIPSANIRADVWKDIYNGFEVFGYQLSGNKNILGDGWDIQLNNVFSGQRFNVGFADLTLGATSPATSTLALGYTTRLIPSASFSWTLGSAAQPLSYSLRINNGAQSFTGTMFSNVSTDINILGFYDTRVTISNRGEYENNGALPLTDGKIAYDVGPINISGNIYLDALAAITQPFYTAAGTENPFTKLSGRAAKTAALNATVDDLRARVQAGEILSDEDMATLVNSTLLSSIINGGTNQDGLLAEVMSMGVAADSPNGPTLRMLVETPEPATLLGLLALGLLLVRRRTR